MRGGGGTWGAAGWVEMPTCMPDYQCTSAGRRAFCHHPLSHTPGYLGPPPPSLPISPLLRRPSPYGSSSMVYGHVCFGLTEANSAAIPSHPFCLTHLWLCSRHHGIRQRLLWRD